MGVACGSVIPLLDQAPRGVSSGFFYGHHYPELHRGVNPYFVINRELNTYYMKAAVCNEIQTNVAQRRNRPANP